jgi:hypothetical protein
MIVSTGAAINCRDAVRTMVMTAGVSSRGGCRCRWCRGIEVVDFGRLGESVGQGCSSARANTRELQGFDFCIDSYPTPANRRLPPPYTPSHTHTQSRVSSRPRTRNINHVWRRKPTGKDGK